jgi:hypothetical protein
MSIDLSKYNSASLRQKADQHKQLASFALKRNDTANHARNLELMKACLRELRNRERTAA